MDVTHSVVHVQDNVLVADQARGHDAVPPHPLYEVLIHLLGSDAKAESIMGGICLNTGLAFDLMDVLINALKTSPLLGEASTCSISPALLSLMSWYTTARVANVLEIMASSLRRHALESDVVRAQK